MKNLKKTLAMVLVIALFCAASIGLTVAYLTDRDSVANVFTVGDVKIELSEEFEQGALLVPGMNIEKAPIITNTGSNDAWVWATIAIPAALDNDDASKNVIHFNFTKEGVAEGQWLWTNDAGEWMVETMTIDGVEYKVYTALYQTVLKNGEATAHPVITKVYMDPHIDIDPEGNWHHVEGGVVTDLDWNSQENGNPVIYVSAYAIQAEGFATVQEGYAAYKAQWGEAGVEIAPIVMDLGDYNGGYVAAEATTVVQNGSINSTGTGYGARTPYGGTTTYNDIDVVSEGGGVNAWGTVIWNGGDVTTNSTSTSPRHVFYVASAEGEADGHLTINGGEFTFSPTNLTRKGSYLCAQGADAVIIVNGGTFHKPSTRTAPVQELDGGSVTIYGGTFAWDPSNWVAEGYEAVLADGWWTVQAK